MKTLRRLIAVTLTLGLNFSLCTGGLLSVASAFTVEVSREFIAIAPSMTPAVVETTLCASMTPAGPQEKPDTVARTSAQSKGCSQGQACLTSSSGVGRERSITFDIPVLTLVPAIEIAWADNASVKPTLARDGPQYEEAKLLASVLLKRE